MTKEIVCIKIMMLNFLPNLHKLTAFSIKIYRIEERRRIASLCFRLPQWSKSVNQTKLSALIIHLTAKNTSKRAKDLPLLVFALNVFSTSTLYYTVYTIQSLTKGLTYSK